MNDATLAAGPAPYWSARVASQLELESVQVPGQGAQLLASQCAARQLWLVAPLFLSSVVQEQRAQSSFQKRDTKFACRSSLQAYLKMRPASLFSNYAIGDLCIGNVQITKERTLGGFMLRIITIALALTLSINTATACPMADKAAFEAAADMVAKSEDTTKASFVIAGMTCGTCSDKVATSLKAVDGILLSAVDYQSGRVEVAFDAQKTSLSSIEKGNYGYRFYHYQ